MNPDSAHFTRCHTALPLLALAIGCGQTDPPSAPTDPPESPPEISAALAIGGFSWTTATPESQGMCGSVKRLGCTRTLANIWNNISNPRHNTKRFLVIRNDRIIYDRGGTLAYPVYSASKGLLGAPTLVHAMSQCRVGLHDPVSQWLGHGDGARWATEWPWTDITVEHLATHTSGVCDYGNSSSVCRNQNGNWQTLYNRADLGGTKYLYPGDAFTIARARSEQNREPALPPGNVLEYSNVGHGLMNYVVQKACGQKLTDIFDMFIRQPGMGSPLGAALIYTDDGQVFNQSTGVARWKGPDGAAVLRLAARHGIWDNRNIEPVRYWSTVTMPTAVAAAAAAGRGVVYENNSKNLFTQSANHRKLSLETFGHGGNYSTLFLTDPLTSTILVRQGENNATGASYLTKNGCAPGWTGEAPVCTAGTDWTNNWGVANGKVGSSLVGVRKKVVEPLQEAFFFPPPFCRMTAVAGQPVDHTTDVYATTVDAATVDLIAEIAVNPREGAGSSVIDRVEFYQEAEGVIPRLIGKGTLIPGTSPAQYRLAYPAASHGAPGESRTYFASCVGRSTVDPTRKVPSYSQPVRVLRASELPPE
jgi:CubicO group peptidase (beta-lactamase class C family)